MRFKKLLEMYEPDLNLFDTLVLSTASSKYCSLTSTQLWELDWDLFKKEVQFTQMMQAAESAAHKDAAIQTK